MAMRCPMTRSAANDAGSAARINPLVLAVRFGPDHAMGDVLRAVRDIFGGDRACFNAGLLPAGWNGHHHIARRRCFGRAKGHGRIGRCNRCRSLLGH